MKTIFFGAGCFWGVEEGFRVMSGVDSTEVGFMGGTLENPSYEDVCTDKTGHAEVVKVIYHEDKIKFETLLDFFFEMHDPTQLNRQGVDIGTQYRSAIFYTDEYQKRSAKEVINTLTKSKKYPLPIVTEVVKATKFYPAEEYHQKYLFKAGKSSCHI